MPIYEYHCTHCKKDFELLQKIGSNKAECPKCHKIAKKLVSKTSFALKGSGWYKDGYSKTGKSEKTDKSTKKKTD